MDVKLEDLLVSYLQCRSNKRNTKAALQFELDWESDLMELSTGMLFPYTSPEIKTSRRKVQF